MNIVSPNEKYMYTEVVLWAQQKKNVVHEEIYTVFYSNAPIGME